MERLESINIRAEEKCIPMHIHLELTYRCNLKCVHCYCVEDKERQEGVVEGEAECDEQAVDPEQVEPTTDLWRHAWGSTDQGPRELRQVVAEP